MKSIATLLSTMILLAAMAFAQSPSHQMQPFPSSLKNAKLVYVTSYDGSEYSPDPLPADREAIASVQKAIQQWGRYVLVYKPAGADMIIAVQSRPTEDVLAVYDPRLSHSQYLWRETQAGGLQQGETPLVTDLKQA
ncbi:MAG: hypothetical protein H0X25_08460, partial [Acidobacteriales bacterium]|nr:hypothetical protein [Terriglobales bacterium]